MAAWEDEVDEMLWEAEAHVWASELQHLFAVLGDGPFAVYTVTDTQTGPRRNVRLDVGPLSIELDEVTVAPVDRNVADSTVMRALGDVDLAGGVHGEPGHTVVPVRHRDGTWSTLVARTMRCLTD